MVPGRTEMARTYDDDEQKIQSGRRDVNCGQIYMLFVFAINKETVQWQMQTQNSQTINIQREMKMY